MNDLSLTDVEAALGAPDATHQPRLIVRRVSLVARDVVALELGPIGAESLPNWEPGAHVDLTLPSGIVRQYSLCGDLDDSDSYRIAVLRAEPSRGGSEEIHETDLVGKELTIGGPRNTFRLDDAPSYLFLAGGIGITPIIPMVQQAERGRISWTLVYAGRTRDRMAFVDELEDRRQGQLELVVGDRPDFDAILAAADRDTAVYCCGPAGMIEAVKSACLPSQLLRIERFVPDSETLQASDEIDTAFEVELAQSGVTVTVPSDRSILDVVLDEVPNQLYSCKEGVCGTCMTRVLAGEPEHRDSVLSDEEREQYMMICVGRSRSAKLVLAV